MAQLPDVAFEKIGDMVRICYAQGDLPTTFMHSQTVFLYKGEGQWQDPDRWRPIAMSNSIDRLMMRCVHAKIYPMLVTWLRSPCHHCELFNRFCIRGPPPFGVRMKQEFTQRMVYDRAAPCLACSLVSCSTSPFVIWTLLT